MKNKLTALDKIYDCLLNGGEFGEYMEPAADNPVRQPIWWPVLWFCPRNIIGGGPNKDLLYARHYGSSAWRFNKKNLRWVIRVWFECKPSVFLTAYQCRFG